MEEQVAREVRFLKRYALVATLVCVALFSLVFAGQSNEQTFGEINVERINIIEQDGTLRMVISNQERQHPGIVNGKIIRRDYPRPPGMIFFNHLGDEMGGLVFGENGGIGHFGQLTFDKVRNDQTIGFRYLESDDGTYSTGLEVWQQPNLPADVVQEKWDAANSLADETAKEAAIQAMADSDELTTQRLFLGKWRNNAAVLALYDIKGNARIRLSVAADGMSKLEFLDEAGEVSYSVPE